MLCVHPIVQWTGREVKQGIAGEKRAMIKPAEMKHRFLGEKSLNAVYLRNSTITPVLKKRKFLEMLFGRAPNNGNIRLHQYASFIHRHKNRRSHRFDDHAERGA